MVKGGRLKTCSLVVQEFESPIPHILKAVVVQRIRQWLSKPLIWVQFPATAFNEEKVMISEQTKKKLEKIVERIVVAVILILCFSIIVFVVSVIADGFFDSEMILKIMNIAETSILLSIGAIVIIIMIALIEFFLPLLFGKNS